MYGPEFERDVKRGLCVIALVGGFLLFCVGLAAGLLVTWAPWAR